MRKEAELMWEKEKESESELKGQIAEKIRWQWRRRKVRYGDRPSYDYYLREERARTKEEKMGPWGCSTTEI
jgi:isocitrate lyase